MARDHGFHPARITRTVQETPDARTLFLDPATFPPYRAGQFVTVRAPGGELRSYSMCTTPETDSEPAVTVKRVPGGSVSGWLVDEVRAGDTLQITAPAGSFCLREGATVPLVAFAGGSGITPVFALVKAALAATDRPVRVLSAHRDAASALFAADLDRLAAEHAGRLEVVHHLDQRDGIVTEEAVRKIARSDLDSDFCLCGPAPFMDLVTEALGRHGVAVDRVLRERFTPAEPSPSPAAPVTEGSITVELRGRRRTVPPRAGETLLQTARRAGHSPPFSCEAGECATCMARITAGAAVMRENHILEDDEVADGYVLTCQAEPTTPDVTVVYEA